uniref:DBD_Tnp_Mut domain-containing protein n=1 Tax=Angiostrongylus cantonensis TaxID=6313 RepID=A0A0K0DNQ9_ANGCA
MGFNGGCWGMVKVNGRDKRMDDVATVNYSDYWQCKNVWQRLVVMKALHAYGAAQDEPIEQVKPIGSETFHMSKQHFRDDDDDDDDDDGDDLEGLDGANK